MSSYRLLAENTSIKMVSVLENNFQTLILILSMLLF